MSLHHAALETPLKRDNLEILITSDGVGVTRRKIYRLPHRLLLLIVVLIFGVLIVSLFSGWMSWAGNTVTIDNLDQAFKSGMNGIATQRKETLAATLEREVRVLCWVMTTPANHKTKAIHVMRTWGKRCNKLYFVTSQPDDELDTIVLEKLDTYEVLWGKTKAALKYIYENLLDEADWFMKADDDTFVFVENLRYMLYPFSTTWPIYFGYNFKLFTSKAKNAVYMSGGSGYVLSREALRRFVVNGLTDPTKCRQKDNSAEDVEIGTCLMNVGVFAGDSRDVLLKNRFLPFAPYSTLISNYNGMDFWYFKYAFYNPRACVDCLSEYPVAFHYVSADELYVYDYFNYEFDAYGLPQYEEQMPTKVSSFVVPPSDNIMLT